MQKVLDFYLCSLQTINDSFFYPWPFSKQGIDFIGRFPIALQEFKFAVVVVDYFTKQAEALLLTSITEKNMSTFIRENLIYTFVIPHSIVFDNGLQFDNQAIWDLYNEFRIRKDFLVPYHPQSNRQVKAVSKIIKIMLRGILANSKGDGQWSYPQSFRAIVRQLEQL